MMVPARSDTSRSPGVASRTSFAGQIWACSHSSGAGKYWIVGAYGKRLLVGAETPCYSSASLLWFNLSTRREQILFKPPRGLAGVLGARRYGQPIAGINILVTCAWAFADDECRWPGQMFRSACVRSMGE
jgi:hypothetical protein